MKERKMVMIRQSLPDGDLGEDLSREMTSKLVDKLVEEGYVKEVIEYDVHTMAYNVTWYLEVVNNDQK